MRDGWFGGIVIFNIGVFRTRTCPFYKSFPFEYEKMMVLPFRLLELVWIDVAEPCMQAPRVHVGRKSRPHHKLPREVH